MILPITIIDQLADEIIRNALGDGFLAMGSRPIPVYITTQNNQIDIRPITDRLGIRWHLVGRNLDQVITAKFSIEKGLPVVRIDGRYDGFSVTIKIRLCPELQNGPPYCNAVYA